MVFVVLGAVLVLFVVVPLLATVLSTSPALLWETLLDAETRASLYLTFYAAAWATVLAFVCGIPLAYLLARRQFRGKRWVEGIVNLPIVIPHTAAGIALLMVFGRQAFLGRMFGWLGLEFVDHTAGIVVGMLFVSLPYLVNGSREAFELIDPELERVAQIDGASRWQAFFRITLPLAWRGIAGSALLMWGRGISEFGAIVILAYHPKIIPVLVYERFTGYGLDAAQPVALILIVASMFVFIVVNALVRRPGIDIHS
jgi:molybdate/tungstate transport system permease protein